jgi:hypothetical protein
MTRQVQSRGLQTLVVGRNGQGYSPDSWPRSDTFRQHGQANLLIGDNQTRHFEALSLVDQRALADGPGTFLPGQGGGHADIPTASCECFDDPRAVKPRFQDSLRPWLLVDYGSRYRELRLTMGRH